MASIEVVVILHAGRTTSELTRLSTSKKRARQEVVVTDPSTSTTTSKQPHPLSTHNMLFVDVTENSRMTTSTQLSVD